MGLIGFVGEAWEHLRAALHKAFGVFEIDWEK
jgi:hypothetical protein